jgi:amphi-Trp domain-containing protein
MAAKKKMPAKRKAPAKGRTTTRRMEPVKIETKSTVGRQEAAAWLSELARQLAAGDEIELERKGVHFKFGVPDEVELELELEIGLQW